LGESIVVPDVHQFPGHIACDSRSNSEIVIPVRNREGIIRAVLDVDSPSLNSFDETDRKHLEAIAALVYKP
jgi:GAF domain-containing protein